MGMIERQLEARIALLERKLDQVLLRTGMAEAEVLDRELEDAIDISVTTANPAAIQETLKRRIARRRAAERACA